MATDLSTWVPKKILDVLSERSGHAVTAEEWNALWNRHREQGDDTADALWAVLEELRDTVWHETTGAAEITNPAITAEADPALTVAAQLLWVGTLLDQLKELLGDDGADHLNSLGTAVATHLANLVIADTDTNARIDTLQLGAISNLSHDDLTDRDTAESHPTAAITGLDAALAALTGRLDGHDTTIAAQTENLSTHVNTTGNKHAAGNISANRTGQTGQTVQSLLDQIFTALASISGDISEIVHNDLSGRTDVDAHPTSAITGLDAALTARQRTILSGSTDPAAGLGVDGDVYIKY